MRKIFTALFLMIFVSLSFAQTLSSDINDIAAMNADDYALLFFTKFNETQGQI